MKWNLRWAAAGRTSAALIRWPRSNGRVHPVAEQGSGAVEWQSRSVRLTTWTRFAALGCTVADLLGPSRSPPLRRAEQTKRAVGADEGGGPVRPTPRRGGPRRSLPPN
jgi:hypothetical protein